MQMSTSAFYFIFLCVIKSQLLFICQCTTVTIFHCVYNIKRPTNFVKDKTVASRSTWVALWVKGWTTDFHTGYDLRIVRSSHWTLSGMKSFWDSLSLSPSPTAPPSKKSGQSNQEFNLMSFQQKLHYSNEPL